VGHGLVGVVRGEGLEDAEGAGDGEGEAAEWGGGGDGNL
jgi:hypothetical protein